MYSCKLNHTLQNLHQLLVDLKNSIFPFHETNGRLRFGQNVEEEVCVIKIRRPWTTIDESTENPNVAGQVVLVQTRSVVIEEVNRFECRSCLVDDWDVHRYGHIHNRIDKLIRLER